MAMVGCYCGSFRGMEAKAFVERALSHLPSGTPRGYVFEHWKHAGRPTDEGVGLVPIAGVDPQRVMDAVMDIDHYVGNVAHVSVSRSIPDPRYVMPQALRFYQKVDIPVLGKVHHELVLHRLGQIQGYEVAAWELLKPETDRLNHKEGFRSDYNLGAWFCKPGVLGYALASAPRKDDVGRLKFAALTRGADAAASRVLKQNIEGMAAWAARR
jgi:hypothetical protein